MPPMGWRNDVYGIVHNVPYMYIKGIVYNIASLSEKNMKNENLPLAVPEGIINNRNIWNKR